MSFPEDKKRGVIWLISSVLLSNNLYAKETQVDERQPRNRSTHQTCHKFEENPLPVVGAPGDTVL